VAVVGKLPVTSRFATANPFRLRTNPSCVRTCGGLSACAPHPELLISSN
jgi:hypothetical protein